MTVLQDDVGKLRMELKSKIESAQNKESLIEEGGLDEEQLIRFVVLNELKNRDKKNDGDACMDESAMMELIKNTPPPLLKQMVIADGAKGGQYIRAIQIYQTILKESDKAAAAAAVADASSGGGGAGGPTPKFLDPPEENRSYSSVFQNNKIGTGHCRSKIDSEQGWSVQHNNNDQWMIIDAGKVVHCGGIVMANRKEGCYNQLVTQIAVDTRKDENDSWEVALSDRNTGLKAVKGSEAKLSFDHPIEARYVRIRVLKWENHISMRCALLLAAAAPSTISILDPPEEKRSYSSIFGNNKIGTGHARSKIDSEQGWSAQHNNNDQWMIIDAGKVVGCGGIVIANRTNDCHNQLVTQIAVDTRKNENESWQVAIKDRSTGLKAVKGSEARLNFDHQIEARFVRIRVLNWENHISMRCALLVGGGGGGSTVQQASSGEDDDSGILNRLALAIALEHAVPLPQDNPKEPPVAEADKFVDPVRRYLNYESAYLEGELDPAFDMLEVWELRMVVDGTEPDETLAWGRQMLRTYKPDNVLRRDYCRMVNTNIQYGSNRVKNDRPTLQLYQNILMNGGICGRRAFFGRFMLRAFGIPTTARPSPGHGALVHWTPDKGWVPKLGPGWGKGWTKGIYGQDVNFLATTKARENPKEFEKVKRAQWIGTVMEEKPFYGRKDNQLEKNPNALGYWYGLSLTTQDKIVGSLPPAGNRKVATRKVAKKTIVQRCLATKVANDAKTIAYNNDKTILIPPAAFNVPKSVKGVETVDCMDLENEGGGVHPLQIYLPAFSPTGLTIMRGGTWKSGPEDIRAGFRLQSAGYGHYHDWGFRVACGGFDEEKTCPPPTMTIDLEDDKGNTGAQMEFVYIPPGTFLMGGSRTEGNKWACVEVPKHQVTLTKGFYLGKFPVTQAQYQVVMGNNPSKSTKDPNCPVDDISVDSAIDFCTKLVDTVGKDFRLPTEAEWEYACRGGVKEDLKRFFGDDDALLGEYAWYKENSGGHSHPVGQKKPNPFGLYDILGNVLERVSDKYDKDYYAKSPSVDPTGFAQGIHSIFDYKISAPEDGTYSLVAEVATANDNQTLNILVGGGDVSAATVPSVVLKLPFTCGMWQESSPVQISLKGGDNILHFWRDKPPQYGVAVKRFRLEKV